MAIYRPPPSPFVGGHQPLAPADLPPAVTAVAVDDPPFVGSARRLQPLTTLRYAWVPPPPPPQVAWKLSPSLEAVAEDQPPFGQRAWLSRVLSTWQLPFLRLSPAGKLVPQEIVAVDNPPSDPRRWWSVVLQAWQPPPPAPQVAWKLSSGLLDVPVDVPPFGLRSWMVGVLQVWQPGPPRTQMLFRGAPPPSVAVTVEGHDKTTLGTKESTGITLDPTLGGWWGH